MLKNVVKAVRKRMQLQDGYEVPDSQPLFVEGVKRPENITDQIRRMIRTETSLAAQMSGHETFEEADDFEIGDDFEPHSPYENDFDPDFEDRETSSSSFIEERPSDDASTDSDSPSGDTGGTRNKSQNDEGGDTA